MTAQLCRSGVPVLEGPFHIPGALIPFTLTLSCKGVRLWRVALITKWLVRGRVYSYILAVKWYIMDCETYLQAIGGSAMALGAVNQGILLVRVPLWITTNSCAEY